MATLGMLALASLASLAWHPVAAQPSVTASPPPAATGSAAPAPPEPVSVSALATRADADESMADRSVRMAAVANPSEELTRRLDDISASVDQLQRAFTVEQLRRLPVMRLDGLTRYWAFDARRFARWQQEMQLQSDPVLDDGAALSRRRAEWEDVRSRIHANQLPEVLAGRVDGLIARLREAERRMAAPMGAQIDLRQRGNAVGARIQQGQASVAEANAYIDRRLLRLDTGPLWDARLTTTSGADPLATMQQGIEIEARFATEYRAANSERPFVLHALQVLLLPLLMWLSVRSRRAAKAAGNPAAAAPVAALQRPFSLWLLLAMLAVFVFEPDAPLMLHEAAMLVAVVPVLRLMPDDARQRLGAWPYVTAALFLLVRLGFLLSGIDLLYRLFLLALELLTIGAALWLLRRRVPRTAEDAARAPWGRLVTLAAWGGVLLMVVAIVVNVAGNVSLAETLTDGLVDSSYMALMLYAGTHVCAALLQWLVGRRSRMPQHAASLVQIAVRLLAAAGIAGWLVFSLERFRVLRPVRALLTDVLSANFEVGEISINLGNVLVFFIAVLISFWAARLVRTVVHDEVLGRMRLARGVGNSVASLVYYMVLLLGLLLALSAAGFKTSQLTLVFGALGVGIGFGLQSVVNNYVSGLVLMFERPIQPGDVIDIGTTSGTVGEIGLRATSIRTFEGADMVVPNGLLVAGNLTNWTLRDRSRRIELALGVAYGSAPAEVIALLQRTAAQTPGVVAYPQPVALFMAFGASALDFSLRAWTDDFDNWLSIRSDLATRVHDALAEAGIEIPFPQRDLHLRSVSEEAAGALGKAGQAGQA